MILLTGANGFLGNAFRQVLNPDEIDTLGLFNCTINIDLSANVPAFTNTYSKVIHAAGKAHVVPRSPEQAKQFFQINVEGTRNLLRGLENLPVLPRQIIFISTVAVYGCETGNFINETSPLNGITPYAKSKIEAESLLQEWGLKNNVHVLILRLPLLVGANPPGNLGSMLRAIQKGYYFRIGNSEARRSMLLASDVATFVNKTTNISGIYNLTDGYHPTFLELENRIAKLYHRKIKTIPYPLARFAAKTGDHLPGFPFNSLRLEKMTQSLTFSDEKARSEIQWHSKPVLSFFEE